MVKCFSQASLKTTGHHYTYFPLNANNFAIVRVIFKTCRWKYSSRYYSFTVSKLLILSLCVCVFFVCFLFFFGLTLYYKNDLCIANPTTLSFEDIYYGFCRFDFYLNEVFSLIFFVPLVLFHSFSFSPLL